MDDTTDQNAQEWLNTILRGRKIAKRDERGRRMTQKGANPGTPAYATGKSNTYNSNGDHLRAFYLKRRNHGKGSR